MQLELGFQVKKEFWTSVFNSDTRGVPPHLFLSSFDVFQLISRYT